jgi:hypothetical protein
MSTRNMDPPPPGSYPVGSNRGFSLGNKEDESCEDENSPPSLRRIFMECCSTSEGRLELYVLSQKSYVLSARGGGGGHAVVLFVEAQS